MTFVLFVAKVVTHYTIKQQNGFADIATELAMTLQ